MTDEWMPVLGGPRDGVKYLPSTTPKPGSKVNLNESKPGHVTGQYRVSECGTYVVWNPYPKPVPVGLPGLSLMRHLARGQRDAAGEAGGSW